MRFVVCGCHRTYERGQSTFLLEPANETRRTSLTHPLTRSLTHPLTLTRTNGFVIDPLSFVPNLAIGVGFGAPAVGHSVPPLSPIAPSILPGTGSESIVSAILPGSLVLASVRKGVLAVALSLSIDKVSVVHGPVRPGKDSLSVALVLRKVAVVDPAVVPVIDAGAVALVVLVLSLVRVTVGKGRPAVSVPAAVAPVALKDPVVLLVDHAAQSVRHARVPQDDTRVRALVAVGIQQDFVHHLDPFVSKGRAGNRLSHGFVVEGREVALAVLRARRDVDGIEAIGGRRLVAVAVFVVVVVVRQQSGGIAELPVALGHGLVGFQPGIRRHSGTGQDQQVIRVEQGSGGVFVGTPLVRAILIITSAIDCIGAPVWIGGGGGKQRRRRRRL
mmetsp:Transcript_19637/g.54797  ORF Transcript_19637/g.54797 Transcript_19637/m.54797 type:complete len:387 (-) Transcript_19637:3198-4358(-)